MTAAAVFWTCCTCTLVGDADKGAEKHTKATSHTTMTGTDPGRLAVYRDILTRTNTR